VDNRRGSGRDPHYRSLPARFRRGRLLILGCGDVGQRLARLVGGHVRVFGVVRRPEAAAALRASGAVPIVVDLDDRLAAARLAGLADRVVHCAPPPPTGDDDPRTRRAIAALSRAKAWVYLSTTGVYGDCAGARFDETRTVAPASARARRRVAAEARLRRHAATSGARVSILRVPGIYAADRLPLERLRQGTPALAHGDDVFTNHIHADDLARIARAALARGRSTRVYHASDDSELMMGEYFDRVARAYDLPAPPRLPRAELKRAVSPALYTFMSESRRLINRRLKDELRVSLRYPTVDAFLQGRRTDRGPRASC
jgi:nucleoside-diphosphate-sugar epimerase